MQINAISFHAGKIFNSNNYAIKLNQNSKTSFGEKQYNQEATDKLDKLWHNRRKSQNDFWKQVKTQILAGADPNIQYQPYWNGLQRSLLHDAAEENNTKMVDFLLKHGANMYAEEGMDSYTTYDIAITRDDIESLKIFKEHDESFVNARNFKHETPLMVAAKHNSHKAMKFLLENGAKVDAWNDFKACGYPFNYSFENHDVTGMALLIEHGAKPYIDSAYLPFDDKLDSQEWIGHYEAREIYRNAIDRYHSARRTPSRPDWVCGLVTPYPESDYQPLPSYEDVRSHLSSPALAGE